MKIQFKSSEVLILLAASVMSFLANLPDHMLANMVDRRALLAALTGLVVVAMFRYLQIFLLLTITILAVGANLPTDLAVSLGISQITLIVVLGILIVISLLNRAVKLLPIGGMTAVSEATNERQLLLSAIELGDMTTIQRLLAINVNVNFTENGTTPLHLAAEGGYPEIVRLLMRYGADYRIKNSEGKTPLEISQVKNNFIQKTALPPNLYKPYTSALVVNTLDTRRAEADLWRNQYNNN